MSTLQTPSLNLSYLRHPQGVENGNLSGLRTQKHNQSYIVGSKGLTLNSSSIKFQLGKNANSSIIKLMEESDTRKNQLSRYPKIVKNSNFNKGTLVKITKKMETCSETQFLTSLGRTKVKMESPKDTSKSIFVFNVDVNQDEIKFNKKHIRIKDQAKINDSGIPWPKKNHLSEIKTEKIFIFEIDSELLLKNRMRPPRLENENSIER